MNSLKNEVIRAVGLHDLVLANGVASPNLDSQSLKPMDSVEDAAVHANGCVGCFDERFCRGDWGAPKSDNKPYLTPQQFELLVELIPEPYASMVHVAIYTGLRVSELAGLRWNDIGASSITIVARLV